MKLLVGFVLLMVAVTVACSRRTNDLSSPVERISQPLQELQDEVSALKDEVQEMREGMRSQLEQVMMTMCQVADKVKGQM